MKHYIYAHIHPDTGEILYIGCGCDLRSSRLGSRRGPHRQFMINCKARYKRSQWIVKLIEGLDKTEGHEIERALIKQIQPAFNWLGLYGSAAGNCEDNPRAKLTNEQVREMRAQYATGQTSLRKLGRAYGITHESVRRICNGTDWQYLEAA